MYKGKKNSTRLWIKRARVGLEPDCWLRQATTSIDLNQKKSHLHIIQVRAPRGYRQILLCIYIEEVRTL